LQKLSPEEATALYDAAETASANAYAPYSDFPVGAALLSGTGNVYAGSNVENASYGLSICAERAAIAKMVSSGETSLRAIAVHCSNAESAPCGACRQFILEFGPEAIVIFRRGGVMMQIPVSELLPYAFTKAALM